MKTKNLHTEFKRIKILFFISCVLLATGFILGYLMYTLPAHWKLLTILDWILLVVSLVNLGVVFVSNKRWKKLRGL